MGGRELLDIVDSQFGAIQAISTDEDRILAVVRLIDLLRRQPQLSAIIDDLHAGADEALEKFREHDRATRAALLAAWIKHRAAIEVMRGKLTGTMPRSMP